MDTPIATENARYLLIDLEMTGLNPFIHGVIEFGAMVMNDSLESLDEWRVVLCPPEEVQIDPSALEYNGFTLDQISTGMAYEEFCNHFELFLTTHFPNDQKPIFVGQYIAADISFLMSIFYRANRNDLVMRLWNDIIDTKSIANQVNMIARYKKMNIPFKSTSLSKPGGLGEVLNIGTYKAHTAIGDIKATRIVLKKLLSLGAEERLTMDASDDVNDTTPNVWPTAA